MLSLLLSFLFIGYSLAQCTSDENSVCINIYNKCHFTVWPGIQGSTVPDGGGFKLDEGQSRQIRIPNGWKAARIWARTGCDGNFNCDTGFCGNSEQCEGRGGQPPVSLAEFTLNGHGNQDYYDVSMVDGYNLPILILPIPGTFRTVGGEYDCTMAGGCIRDMNQPNECPQELRVVKNNHIVACKSACLAFDNDEYCCRGAHRTPETCPRNKFAEMFKDACPKAYSYAYDDKTSTFFCRGNNQPSPSYTVQFC